MDEPTTGLHFDDIKMLLGIIDRLVNQKNTVLVIEHNLDVIKVADYIIDLGPEGGKNGGNILFSGSPEEAIKLKIIVPLNTYLMSLNNLIGSQIG